MSTVNLISPSLLLELFLILIVLASLLYSFHRIRVIWFPESVLLIASGLVIGACLVPLTKTFNVSGILFDFDTELLKTILIPPIIYQAALTLDKTWFFGNFWSIITFAIVGTIIATVFYSLGAWWAMNNGWIPEVPILRLIMYGSLISAVDPVATLSTMQGVNAPRLLASIVFGESVINDGVAMAIYESISHLEASGGTLNAHSILLVFGRFFYVMTVSSLIGVLCGLISSFILAKIRRIREVPCAEFIMFISAFACYWICDSIGQSGILSLLTAGIVQGHYALNSLSLDIKVAITKIVDIFSSLAESLTFLLVGLNLPLMKQHWSWNFIFITMTLIIIGRALNVFPLSLILNRFRKVKIGMKFQFCSFVAGLRGAIAFSLALSMPHDSDEELQLYSTTTLMVVLITILVFGCSTYPLLKIMGLVGYDDVLTEAEVSANVASSRFGKFWLQKDSNVYKKWFIRDYNEKIDEAVSRLTEMEIEN